MCFAAALGLIGLVNWRPAAAGPLVGVNVVDVRLLSDEQQDQLLTELSKDGVTTVRLPLDDDRSVRFIAHAFEHHIGSVVILDPTKGSSAKLRDADPGVGLTWGQRALSEADPSGFVKWLEPMFSSLEAANVRLTALELGNEVNTAGYNGDIESKGSGRVLSAADLSTAADPQSRALADSFRAYLKVLRELKQVRDASKANRQTPIVTAGLVSLGAPRSKSGLKQDAVSLPDTIKFLRQNGADNLVDGYGIHSYPAADPNRSVSALFDALNKDAFAMCTSAKPCWLTEWGFDNRDKSCPADEVTRSKVVETMRGALKQFASQKRLSAALYYSWSGHSGEVGSTIFRCGALTEAGKIALNPL